MSVMLVVMVLPLAMHAQKSSKVAASVRQPEIGNDRVEIPSGMSRSDIQARIDDCSRNGGGTLYFLSGTYRLDGPLELKSGVRLHLADGAVLLFSSNPDDYLPVVATRWEGTELYGRSSMIHADGQHDIAVTGEGKAVVDAGGSEMARWGMPGGDPDFVENIHGTHGETPETADVERLRKMGDELVPVSGRVFGEGTKLRPCAMEFRECRRVLVEGITLKDSPFWCIHPLYCEDVTVRGVTIDSHFPNNDGCDPESSRRVLVENCTFLTGDDAIAIKSGRDADGRRVGRPSEDIVIRNCRFFSKCNGLCIGSEMSGGVKGVYMTGIEIGDVKNALLFKSNLDRGGYIEDVFIDSVSIGNVAGAVLRFETNYFGYRGGNMPARYSGFTINNVSAKSSAAYAIYFDGNEAEPIRGITVNNFIVDETPRPYYLFHTRDCRFNGCKVGGKKLPVALPESESRQQCDVW